MSAGRYDTVVEQGATFYRVCTWKTSSGVGINLTSYTLTGKIKKKLSDTNELVSFTITKADQTSYAGQFTISLTSTQTAALPVKPQTTEFKELLNLYYDIEADSGTEITRIIEGVLGVSPQVTT
jgi:hypothetical protein